MEDLFRQQKWHIPFRAGIGPDGNRDIEIERTAETESDFSLNKYVVQCKRYESTVGVGHVTDIRDTVERYGAEGFILAVSSTISQPLLTKLSDLTKNGFECHALRPLLIHDMITKCDEIFIKYFPDEFERFSSLLPIFGRSQLSELVESLFEGNLEDSQVTQLQRQLAIQGFDSITAMSEVLTDESIASVIEETYAEVLKRKPTLNERVSHSLGLSKYESTTRKEVFSNYLMNTFESLSRMRFLKTFDDMPLGKVTIDRAGQGAYGFNSYHSDHENGVIEVCPSEAWGVERELKIYNTGDSEFRIKGLNQPYFRKINFLSLDYVFDGSIFQVFILVRSSSGNLYFIQYIDGEGETQVVDDSGIKYVQIYSLGFENGPTLRKEMNFVDDFSKITGESISDYIETYIGVQGTLSIVRILSGGR